jgi:AAA15 family ATPase/GTPase
MIKSVAMQNFGPLLDTKWENLGNINVLIGANSSGKSFYLKALYTAIKSLEGYKRGNENKTLAEILADKLYWTFQVPKIGDLVTKGQSEALSFQFEIDNKELKYSFGRETTKKILSLENDITPITSNSIFLPAKEVLSIYQNIIQYYDQYKTFGFDDTYVDLVRALSFPCTRGKKFPIIAKSRKELGAIINGKIEFDTDSQVWQYKKGKVKYPISVTSEGIKKIGILDTLLGNRYLTPQSTVFIDEPEAALHPSAISLFLEIISELAKLGMQFFMATHSYFVIKKLYLITKAKKLNIPIASFEDDKWIYNNLINGMPDNSIINESIKLYEEEVDLVLQ